MLLTSGVTSRGAEPGAVPRTERALLCEPAERQTRPQQRDQTRSTLLLQTPAEPLAVLSQPRIAAQSPSQTRKRGISLLAALPHSQKSCPSLEQPLGFVLCKTLSPSLASTQNSLALCTRTFYNSHKTDQKLVCNSAASSDF